MIHTHGFFHHGVQFRKKGMLGIGLVMNLPAIPLIGKQSGLFQLLQLFPDLTGRNAELIGQLTKIGLAAGIKKEPHQDTDPDL
jgi:hypothetical protein